MRFDGATFDAARDAERLEKQLDAVKALMLDGQARTLAEIRAALHLPPDAAVDARLRDLRKSKFGGYQVDRLYRGSGVWAYRVLPREIPSVMELMTA